MKEFVYTVVLDREEDGGYHVFCPALPGCHAQGDSYDEAIENIRDSIKLYIESLTSHGEEIPVEDITVFIGGTSLSSKLLYPSLGSKLMRVLVENKKGAKPLYFAPFA